MADNIFCIAPGCDAVVPVTGWSYCRAHRDRYLHANVTFHVSGDSAAPEGRKDDAGKPRWDLLPWRGAEEVVKVLTFGARKYAPENWRKVDGWRWRYFRAAIGHLAKWQVGEKLDPESQLPHLAHAACCVLFMLELDDQN